MSIFYSEYEQNYRLASEGSWRVNCIDMKPASSYSERIILPGNADL